MNSGTDGPHANTEQQREQLSAYLDDELSAAERAALEGHLAECSECREQLAQLRQVRSLLRALPAPVLPRSFALPIDAPEPVIFGPPLRGRHPGRGPRLARVAEWLGSAAAVAGLALLIGSAVHLHGPRYAAGGASTGAAPAARQQTATATGTTGGGAALPSLGRQSPQVEGSQSPSAAAATPASTPALQDVTGTQEQNPPVLPLTGAGLAIGGVALLVTGKSVERRRR